MHGLKVLGLGAVTPLGARRQGAVHKKAGGRSTSSNCNLVAANWVQRPSAEFDLSRARSPVVTMSGCGNANCSCGSDCSCGSGCSCERTMSSPSFGGLRNYNAENDCKCGPNCACADCQCHK